MNYRAKKNQLQRECDDAANEYWKLPASERPKAYEKWMKHIRNYAVFIGVLEKNGRNVD